MARYATAHDLLDYLKFSRATLYRKVKHDPAFPRPIYIGRTRRFDLEQVDAWLATRADDLPSHRERQQSDATNAARGRRRTDPGADRLPSRC